MSNNADEFVHTHTRSSATLSGFRQLRVLARYFSVDLGVWFVAAATLLFATVYRHLNTVPPQRVSIFGNEVVAVLPAGWRGEQKNDYYRAQPPSLHRFVPTLEVRRIGSADNVTQGYFADIQVARIEQERSRWGVGYRVLQTEEKRSFGGHPSSWIHFAVVRDPPGTSPGAAVLPTVILGVDVFVQSKNGSSYHLAAWQPAQPVSVEGTGEDPSDESYIIEEVLESIVIRE